MQFERHTFMLNEHNINSKTLHGDSQTAEFNGLVFFIVNLLLYVGFIFIIASQAHCT